VKKRNGGKSYPNIFKELVVADSPDEKFLKCRRKNKCIYFAKKVKNPPFSRNRFFDHRLIDNDRELIINANCKIIFLKAFLFLGKNYFRTLKTSVLLFVRSLIIIIFAIGRKILRISFSYYVLCVHIKEDQLLPKKNFSKNMRA
jgi:hypothetical protein